MGDLEHQLVRFPSGEHDDLIDAEQSLIRLLEFPKGQLVKKEQKCDFDWWRTQSINYRKQNENKKTGKPFIFGRKRSKFVTIPFQKGI
jgi:hypothetical protein